MEIRKFVGLVYMGGMKAFADHCDENGGDWWAEFMEAYMDAPRSLELDRLKDLVEDYTSAAPSRPHEDIEADILSFIGTM